MLAYNFNSSTMEVNAITELEAELTCPTCKKLIVNAVLTGCGVKICRYCLVTWLREKKSCPMCKSHCKEMMACPKVDSRITNAYKLVGPQLRSERQMLLNHRRLLQRKFDLDIEMEHLSASEDALSSLVNSTGRRNSKGSRSLNPTPKPSRKFALKNTKKPKKSISLSKTTGKSKSVTNSKPTVKPFTDTSSSISRYGKHSTTNFSTLEEVDQANEKLNQELTASYNRFLADAMKNAQIEENMLFGSGDRGIVRNLKKPSQSISYTGLNQGNTLVPIRNSTTGIAHRKPDADEILNHINSVSAYLKDSALEAITGDVIPGASKTAESKESKQATALLHNVLEIQLFLEKKIKTKAEKNQRDAETQTDVQMAQMLGSAAAILREKLGKTPRSLREGIINKEK